MEAKRLFLHTVQQLRMVSPGDRVVLAISGGPDSMAMLNLFLECRETLRADLFVAHVNHGLRGAEAMEDAAFVERVAGSHGLPFACRSLFLKGKDQGLNVEALARNKRYAFLDEIAFRCRAQRVALAHTLDDQAETVLMRFFREGARRGVSGMRPIRGSLYIRPLIRIGKDALLDYLQSCEIPYRVDSSNGDLRYLRNRIRRRVLPLLCQEINPNLKARLARLGSVLAVEDEYLDALALSRLSSVGLPNGNLDVDALLAVPPALRPRVLKQWMGPGIWCESVHLDAIVALLSRPSATGRVALPGSITFLCQNRRGILLRVGRTPMQAPYAYPLVPCGAVEIPEVHARVRTEVVSASEVKEEMAGKGVLREFFDMDAIGSEMIVRNRRPGDRIKPFGMRGRKRVSDLMASKKIPRELRSGIPLLVWGGRVQWVPGCGRSAEAPVRPDTKTAMRVELSWLSPGRGAERGLCSSRRGQ